MEGAGATAADYAADPIRWLRAEAIIVRRFAENKRLSDCWKEVNPGVDENPRVAAKMRRRTSTGTRLDALNHSSRGSSSKQSSRC